MKTFIAKNKKVLVITGVIFLWYNLSILIDLLLLKDSGFSKLLFLQEAYLGMKPIGLPLPETGILLFILGCIPILVYYQIFIDENRKEVSFKSIVVIIGTTLLFILMLFPILVLGEIAYYIVIDKLCGSVRWLNWLKEVADLFTFKAKFQISFMKNPITLDMSLGSVLGIIIGIPIIKKKIFK